MTFNTLDNLYPGLPGVQFFAKDKNHVYFQDASSPDAATSVPRILVGVDAPTFHALSLNERTGNVVAADQYHKYDVYGNQI